jgi:leucyl/phenylalanyl-tRNA--protein transferase
MKRLTRLDSRLEFPSPENADAEGIVALGGDLQPERLLLAYRKGIFPWYTEGLPIVWWSPDPRFVLRPEEVRVSRSMRPVLRHHFTITYDRAFERVIAQCKTTPRPGQEGTWITPAMQRAYQELHRLGYAHSVEAWAGDELVGGLYGVSLGCCFFGESMFAHRSNASKAAFIQLCRTLAAWGFPLVDCQVYTQHLQRLGGFDMRRREFLQTLDACMQYPSKKGPWTDWEGCGPPA